MAQLKRPAKVKVLGKWVAIEYVPASDILLRDSADDPDPGCGRSDGSKQSIAIEEGQPLAYEQDTVLHEVLHIIEDYMRMDVPEDVVDKFATGLLAVLKDNPSFASYLRWREK